MLDDLRNSSSFIDDEEPVSDSEVAARPRRIRGRQKDTFLGMTAQQRFFLSLMLFFMFFILGVAALVVTGSVYLPF
jgi:hypothetical protein